MMSFASALLVGGLAEAADGFGARSLGGEGGAVLKVTNLDDAGPGSLRACVEASGPRSCEFEVSGTIRLKQRITIANGRLTIDGSTAPGDGITLRLDPASAEGGPLVRVEGDDVILRHLRLRRGPTSLAVKPGGTCCGDNLGIHGARRVLVDHVSMQFSTDENLDIYGGSDITIQNSLIAYGLDRSTHSLTVDTGKGHSKGILAGYGADRVSILNNLIALHQARGCRIKSGVADCRANYYYGIPDPEFVVSDGAQINVINNVLRYPDAIGEISSAVIRAYADGAAYADGNDLPPGLDLFKPDSLRRLSPVPVTDTPSDLSADRVLDEAGAQPRDGVDAAIVAHARKGTGGLIDDPSEVVPDWWGEADEPPVADDGGTDETTVAAYDETLPTCQEVRAALKALFAERKSMDKSDYLDQRDELVALKNLVCG